MLPGAASPVKRVKPTGDRVAGQPDPQYDVCMQRINASMVLLLIGRIVHPTNSDGWCRF
jgi:hypothetical protein